MRRFDRVLAALLAFSIVMSTTALNVSASATEQTPAAEETTVSSDPAAEQPTESTETQTETSEQPETDTTEEQPQEQTAQEQTQTVNADNAVSTQAEGTLNLSDLIADNNSIAGNADAVTVTCANGDASALVLLSNCKPADLENLTININVSGGLDLTGEATYNSQKYKYNPIGTTDNPFNGTFTTPNIGYTINTPMFGSITSNANISQFIIIWTGTGADPMFVKEYRFTDNESHNIPVKIQPNSDDNVKMGALISEVTNDETHSGRLVVKSDTVQYKTDKNKDATVEVTPTTGDAGLICGSLKAGTIQLDGYTAPTTTSYTVTSSSGNAGGLIGSMADGTGLTVNNTITLTSPTVTGKTNAGGLVGVATNATFDGLENVKVESPTVEVQNKDGNVGGLFGSYTLKGKNAELKATVSGTVKVTSAGNNAKTDTTNVGGLFGVLSLNKNGEMAAKYTLTPDLEYDVLKAGTATAYGAIAGRVVSDGRENSLIIQNPTINSEMNSKDNDKSYYHGGLIGYADGAYVAVQGANVTVKYPYANAANGNTSEPDFGGLIGHMKQSTLKTSDTVKVSIDSPNNDDNIWEGGGLVGYAGTGSAVELNGTTDLTDAHFATSAAKTGLIVAKQENSLIYANGSGNDSGWKYIRTNTKNVTQTNKGYAVSLDDIGNYGQVYRLWDGGLSADFIKIDETTHQAVITNSTNLSGDTIKLSSKEDFAALAIAWQTRCYFASSSSGLTDNNKGAVPFTGKNITLTADINLTGTGVQGLTRDVNGDNNTTDCYTGTFDGGSHTLTLAIGENYGVRDDKDATGASSGQICAHTQTGLFAALGANAKIQNLTLNGCVNVDAVGGSGANFFDAGALAAKAIGATTIENVTLEETVNASLNERGNASSLNVGGMIGYINGDITIGGTAGDVNAKATVSVTNSSNQNSNFDKIFAGGVIGQINKDTAITVNCNNVTLGGEISSEVNNKAAQIGGLIGYSEYNTNKNENKRIININSVTVNGQSVTADSATSCGGLLGYLWADTDVNFNTPKTDNTYALNVTNGTVSATKSGAEAGGLVYRGSGKWTVNNYGISMTGGTFSAANLGLLLCHAGQLTTSVSGSDPDKRKALYLEMTENWETAYNLTKGVTVQNATVFDELVAYTAGVKAAKTIDITTNDRNGIISLATKNHTGVALDGDTCNTYQNRTNYNVKTNPNTRYYYNLNKITAQVKDQDVTQYLNTPEKLLLWSVHTYASNSIKTYFSSDRILQDGNERAIGAASGTSEAILNMKGLSYYPVTVYGKRVQRATVTFYNDEIEALEKKASNKSTTNVDNSYTQHYMMHCGLFYNMISGSDKDQSATISTVTFSGTVGMVNGGSGALACGSIHGNENPAKTYSLNLTTIVLNDLFVNGATDQNYAPVLINEIGSYTSLSADDVDTEGYNNITKPAGSSLIGNVGGDDKTQITVKFSQMHLPDTKYTTAEENTGIFTHATFLEKFEYKADGGVGSGSYTFLRSHDYTDETRDHHKVTYGKEISKSVEYKDEQRKYYDEDTYYTEEKNAYVVISDAVDYKKQDFSAYLPYVCQTKVQKEDEAATKHEIMVNLRAKDILTGCGTYGHPYTITEASEMITLAEYLATATARSDWKVTITADQNTMHGSTNANDVTYIFDGTWKEVTNNNGTWQKKSDGKTLSNTVMHRYLLSAYYNIDKDITLDNFTGLGGKMYPFRGVIVSTNKATIKLTGTVPNGLIPYSYGSVVKDVAMKYEGSGKTLSYSADKDETTISSTGQLNNYNTLPESFFGGVIGCIVGGDNIIDGVSVTMDKDWKLKLDGTKKHLIEVGGYVGSVAGGGVIFRNMDKKAGLSNTNLTGGSVAEDAASSLYVNPYVGRVLDGYAFSEGCTVNNNDKNYKINQLTAGETPNVTTDTTTNTVTVSNEQGLLVLSAIVNSGGASGGKTYAYRNESYSSDGYKFGNGTYGKVRRASYAHVGKSTDDGASTDFTIANADDTIQPGGTSGTGENQITIVPYLVYKYSNVATFSISDNTKNVLIQLAENGNYDLITYGNGYQGISARYLSNAVNAGNNTIGSVYAKPLITGFKGNGSTVKVSMDVKEYADDDFHSASVGGVFNLLRPVNANATTAGTDDANKALVSNLTIAESTVKLTYFDANGTETDEASEKLTQAGGKYCVGVGGFAGSTSANGVNPNDNNTETNSSYFFRNVTISGTESNKSTFKGPNGVGGLIGTTSMADKDVNKGIGLMFRNEIDATNTNTNNQNSNAFGVNLVDCTYSNINVTAGRAAGGFVGYVAGGSSSFYSSNSAIGMTYQTCKIKTSFSVTSDEDVAIGSNSTITSNPNKVQKWANSAGGIFGSVSTQLEVKHSKTMTLNGLKITSNVVRTTDDNGNGVGNAPDSDAGGVAGRIESNACQISNVKIQGDTTISAITGAGGILGTVKNSHNDTTFKIDSCTASDITVKNTYTENKDQTDIAVGGIIGELVSNSTGSGNNAPMYITNCTAKTLTLTSSNSRVSIGGIAGTSKMTRPLYIQGCTVSNTNINDSNTKNGWNGGLLGSMGNLTNNDQKISLYDSTVKETDIYGEVSGALTSSVYTQLYGSNLLIDAVNVYANYLSDGKYGGALLVGWVTNLKKMYLAGVSIQGDCAFDNAKNKDNSKRLIAQQMESEQDKIYIALADYTGTASGENAGKVNTLDATPAAPYVVTNPKYDKIKIQDGDDIKYLFGDGADKTVAQQIWDGKSSGTATFPYSNTGVSNFDFTTAFSTYNTNNATNLLPEDEGSTETNKKYKDFDVLQVNSGEAEDTTKTTIENYLNIITNGGYEQAKTLGQVSAETALYERTSDRTDCIFEKSEEETSPLRVSNSGKDNMSFSTSASNYDTTKQRFTLLTVTFTPEEGHEYKIQVPIIVRRVLEVDFTATLNYGTHFKPSDYDRTSHILDSFGNSITAYLTYTYGSAVGDPVKFGWETFINGGGNVAQTMEKQIVFQQEANVPSGTQLTLIDCQDDNRTAYYYTVKDGSSKTFTFSDFKTADGKNAFGSTSIGERIGIEVTQSDSGNFVETDVESATVKSGGKYYRLATADDVSATKYTVTVPKEAGDSFTDYCTENYYLVITMPQTGDSTQLANGYIRTSFATDDIPYNVNYIRRDKVNNKTQSDTHTNTASTYQLSNGYQQTLAETLETNTNAKELSAADSTVSISIQDKITFPNSQAYNTSDQLYQRFTGILQTQDKNQKVSASSFPSGTNGNVKFYVYTMDENGNKKYYQYNNGEWNTTPKTDKTAAVSYDWTSTGGNMELLLSEDGTIDKAISLQAIRDTIKGTNNTGNSTFYVEAILDAVIPPTGLGVIPESALDSSNGVPSEYAKLSYVSQLSTEKNTLSYSSTKKNLSQTKMQYYRASAKASELTYDADDINQLGINLLDLEPNLDAEKQHAVIATTAIYDLSALQDLQNTLEASQCIRFTMTLKKKDTSNTETYETNSLTNAADYMSIQVDSKTVEPNNGEWTWEIPNTEYVKDGVLSPIDRTQFTQAILLQVNVDDVQAYSNYEVTLTAQVIGSDGKVITQDHDEIIYTLTKINPNFVEQK